MTQASACVVVQGHPGTCMCGLCTLERARQHRIVPWDPAALEVRRPTKLEQQCRARKTERTKLERECLERKRSRKVIEAELRSEVRKLRKRITGYKSRTKRLREQVAEERADAAHLRICLNQQGSR